ncbi:protein IQ-DOMAIN 13 [Telopea speciosissima]|uniref:protein IQ-DOMAIN 13 n=1 Tax=Telopea speciosissima TaxID=54955 RepID=UPI001CC6D6D7|nr:protein IQ-DOMAIN 13 [Telopea speciosissima]
MRKKGSWLSVIKRVFIPNSKEKLHNEGSEKLKSGKEKKKWGYIGRLISHGENNSFITTLNREPSSIENILRDVERDELQMPKKYSHQLLSGEQRIPPRSTTTAQPPVPSAIVNHHKEVFRGSIISTEKYHQGIIKIQAAFRGYMARRSFRALKGLVRLQGVMRGQSVKRQTMNAMKRMQLLVRVQTQIQTRRIQMLDNRALQRQNLHKIDESWKEALGKWITTEPSETGHQEEWDDSILAKEEIEARLQRKLEAIIKREKALAYAYSQQLWRTTPKSAQAALMEIRSGGLPWLWNWVERELPVYPSEIHSAMHTRADLTSNNTINTPRSSKSTIIPFNTKHAPRTTTTTTMHTNSSTPMRHVKAGTGTAALPLDVPLRDDESLMSCPPFSVPNYMVPTISAKAKVRDHSNPKERETAGSSHDRRRRFSFPLTQSIGSLRWNKGSLFSSKDSSSQRMFGKQDTLHSISNFSIDSTVSLPVGVGRKPFKRFV